MFYSSYDTSAVDERKQERNFQIFSCSVHIATFITFTITPNLFILASGAIGALAAWFIFGFFVLNFMMSSILSGLWSSQDVYGSDFSTLTAKLTAVTLFTLYVASTILILVLGLTNPVGWIALGSIILLSVAARLIADAYSFNVYYGRCNEQCKNDGEIIENNSSDSDDDIEQLDGHKTHKHELP